MTDLNDKLAKVIAEVESGGFPEAIRYEPALQLHMSQIPGVEGFMQTIMGANRCNRPTAEQIFCTSYGIFQIMGETLYSTLGWKEPVATFWSDVEQQLASFKDLCKHGGFDPATFDFSDEAALQRFARFYNGPDDVADYVAKMKAAFAALPA